MRFWIVFALIFALLAPLPAIADAHPGFHVNPHFPNVVLYAALGLAATAWLAMAITLALLRRKRKQAEDRLIRARLNLAQAHDDLSYWRARLAARKLLAKLYDPSDYRP